MDDQFLEQLKRHEGFREKPYMDSVGVLTIGYGHNLDEGIKEVHAALILSDDVKDAEESLDRILGVEFVKNLRTEHPVRHAVLVNMAFNLGEQRLMGFAKTLHLVMNHHWEAASREMLNSKWARQVGTRATELAEQMKTGEYPK